MEWWLTILRMVADHPGHFSWSLFCELSFGAKFQVCSTLPSGIFWWGFLLLVSCDGEETKSTPSPTGLDCTVRLDWSLTKRTRTAIIKIYQTQIDGRGSSMDNAILLKMIFNGRDPLMKDKLCTLPLIKQWQQNP